MISHLLPALIKEHLLLSDGVEGENVDYGVAYGRVEGGMGGG